MVDLHADDLIYLLELVRTGRLVDAARRLGVEHTTVSRRVNALEKAVGRHLVHKTARGWRLTDDGEGLLVHAEAIESAVHAVEQIGVGARSSLGGTVRVAAPDGIGASVIPDAVVGLRLAHPQLEVEVTTATRRFDITSRDYDVAITMERARSRRLAVQHFTDYLMGLYATTNTSRRIHRYGGVTISPRISSSGTSSRCWRSRSSTSSRVTSCRRVPYCVAPTSSRSYGS